MLEITWKKWDTKNGGWEKANNRRNRKVSTYMDGM